MNVNQSPFPITYLNQDGFCPYISVSAGFKCAEALGRIIIRGPYPHSNATIYMHLQL